MTIADVYRLAYEYKRLLAGREVRAMARMARQWIGVQDRLTDAISKLAAEFAKLESPSTAKLFQMQRYQELVMQVRSEVARYNNWLLPAIENEQRAMGLLAQRHALAELGQWGVNVGFNLLDAGAVEAMVGFTGSGAPLANLLQQAWPTIVDRLTRVLVDGTALGWNPRKTAREMMRQGVDGGLNRLMMISRTEQLRAYRTATLDRYRASGVVAGYRRVAAKQERTCVACLVEDGKFYELSIEFQDHVNGRCSLVPILSGHEDDLLGRQSGREWFEAQDAEAQQRIMGQGKWDAWQAGKFGLDDLVTHPTSATWGTSIGVTPLKDLEGRQPVARSQEEVYAEWAANLDSTMADYHKRMGIKPGTNREGSTRTSRRREAQYDRIGH